MSKVKWHLIMLLVVILPFSTGIQANIIKQTWYPVAIENLTSLPYHAYQESGFTQIFRASSMDKNNEQVFPRVEASFTHESKISPNKGVYTFSGSFRISEASQTTIMQMINHDTASELKSTPVLCIQIDENSQNQKQWHIFDGTQPNNKMLLATVPKNKSFYLQVKTDGERISITINEKTPTVKYFSRKGSYSHIRYGAVHKGIEGRSEVKVYKAKLELTNNIKA